MTFCKDVDGCPPRTNPITQGWCCRALPEQQADLDCALANQSLGQAIPAAQIDAIFLVYSPGWWETRRDAWAANRGLERISPEPPAPDIPFYPVNQSFWGNLFQSWVVGCSTVQGAYNTCIPYVGQPPFPP